MIQTMQDSFLQVQIYLYLYNFTACYRKKSMNTFFAQQRESLDLKGVT